MNWITTKPTTEKTETGYKTSVYAYLQTDESVNFLFDAVYSNQSEKEKHIRILCDAIGRRITEYYVTNCD
jgi:hypothetical protein